LVVPRLASKSVICGGRPLMIMLGYPQGKSGAIYQIDVDDTGKFVNIAEVVALGITDPCLTK